jgi:protein-S-isoprenylcysteine O-methyltransferase Ste14
MYAGALIMLFGTPLALGSWWGLLMFVLMTFVVGWRAFEEERFLIKVYPVTWSTVVGFDIVWCRLFGRRPIDRDVVNR